jgi:Replication regulatory protein RepB.
MPKTAAERQADYRARRPFAGADNNGERRINTWVNTGTALALERLASHYGVTKREMLERIVLAEETRVTSGMAEDVWEAYQQNVTQ